jgi:ABC-2 type transport system ATP-binding protein
MHNVSFDVGKGQVLGLIGPNGAGKTTLLRIIATLLRPTIGTASVLGHDLVKDYLGVRANIGYMPDFFNLYTDLTLEECLTFFAKAYKVNPSIIDERIDTVLRYVELQDKKRAFIKHLSRGMVQRIGLACLMVHDPEIFLLDEPASGLDPLARIQLRNVLKKLSTDGKTIIISSHILTELSGFCTHIAIMDKGRLVLHGAVKDIEQQLQTSRTIKVSVVEDTQKAVDVLGSIAAVKNLQLEDHTIRFDTDSQDRDLAQINKALVDSGVGVIGFQQQKRDLEGLFLQISAAGKEVKK